MSRPRRTQAVPTAILAACFTLTGALALQAAPPLEMPALATVIGGRAESPATLRLPIGAFAAGQLPMREVAGAVDERAYRLDDQHMNTLELVTPLIAQLEAAGYKPLFQCDTSACGGFDFRYAMDVLPEPQMHVDLGDFRYAALERVASKGPDLVMLLVSRSADAGFVQVTTVTEALPEVTPAASDPAPAADPVQPGGGPAPALPSSTLPSTPLPAPEPTLAPPPPALPATQGDPMATQLLHGDFGQTLRTNGFVVLEDLVFASGSAALEDKDYASLKALADWLAAYPDRKVTLVGHTDASGALPANIALSRQRAQSVRAALVAKFKANPARIDAQGAGYLSPRASNETPEGRTLNRRVEVMLTP